MNTPSHCQDASNSTLSLSSTEEFIVMNARVTGPIYLVTNVLVLCLIFFDSDTRYSSYRKYLIMLQAVESIISILADALLTTVVPVVLAREWILYSIGFLPQPLQMVHALIAYLFLIIEIVSAYIACLIYVHQATIPSGSKFSMKRGKFNLTVIAINVFTLFYLPALWIGLTGAIEEEIPRCLSWLKEKESYSLFYFSNSIWLIVFGGILTAFPLYGIVIFLFLHIVFELSKIRLNSAASRNYQKRMVITLAIQAIVPNISVVIPFATQILVIMLQPKTISQGKDDQTYIFRPINLSDFTAILFSFANSHAMLNSLTILLRSHSYLTTVTKPFRMVFAKCLRGGSINSTSNMTHVSSETRRNQALTIAMISYAA